MLEIILDGELMTDRTAVHDLLMEKFAFPDYYGRNLDALYDLLSTYSEQIHVTVMNQPRMLENLGNYGKALLRTLEEAADCNLNLKFTVTCEKNKNNT